MIAESSVKESLIALVHKEANCHDLSNCRTIAMGAVITKLFTAVLADRLARWARVTDRFSPAQNGFLPHEGCLEHSFVLQRIMESVHIRKKEVMIAWLDLE